MQTSSGQNRVEIPLQGLIPKDQICVIGMQPPQAGVLNPHIGVTQSKLERLYAPALGLTASRGVLPEYPAQCGIPVVPDSGEYYPVSPVYGLSVQQLLQSRVMVGRRG